MNFEAPRRRVDRVFLHCSAWDSDMAGQELLAEVTRWHIEKNTWNYIGYHYLIDRPGEVMIGRDIEITPAAQYGHNKGTIAICVHGLVFPVGWEGSAQAVSLVGLCTAISAAYKGLVSFWAHNEVNSHKTCPVFDHRALLGLDRWRRMP